MQVLYFYVHIQELGEERALIQFSFLFLSKKITLTKDVLPLKGGCSYVHLQQCYMTLLSWNCAAFLSSVQTLITLKRIELAGNSIKNLVSEAGLCKTTTCNLLFHGNKGYSVH